MDIEEIIAPAKNVETILACEKWSAFINILLKITQANLCLFGVHCEERFHLGIRGGNETGVVLLNPPGSLGSMRKSIAEIIGYVARKKKEFILNEAVEEEGVLTETPKSVLCFPVHLSSGETIGIVYLEHIADSGCFTLDRIEMIRFLVEQIANNQTGDKAGMSRTCTDTLCQGIFDHSIEGMFYTTLDGQMIEANQPMAAMLGFRAPETLVKSVANIYQQLFSSLDKGEECRTLMRKNGGFEELEVALSHQTGKQVWTMLKGQRVEGAQDRPPYVQYFALDLSARKSTEASLKLSEQRFRAAANACVDIIWEYNIVTNQVSVFALSDDFVGRNFIDLPTTIEEHYQIIHPDDLARVRKKNEEAGKSGENTDISYRVVLKDGSVRHLEERMRCIKHVEQKPTVWVGAVTDVTERMLALEILRERESYLRQENIRLRTNLKDRYRFGDIYGKSPAMQEVYEMILKAAATDASVVVYGETGTGKELVARAVHKMSERNENAFIAVNCSAIPKDLLESEFFGHKKGAFSGAVTTKPGYIDLAENGSLFLDEVGEIDINLQAKMLRAIEKGGYRPVGGTEEKRTDFRIIAATNRDLREHLRTGLMREDFFYRIHIIDIHIPPLRERKEDIPLLVDHFLAHHSPKKKVPVMTGMMMNELMTYDWPGNVRELQNTLLRFVTTHKLEFLGAQKSPKHRETADLLIKESLDTKDQRLKTAMAEFEKKYILQTLESHQWHRSNVARILGIGRKTLFTKIQTYGLNQLQ